MAKNSLNLFYTLKLDVSKIIKDEYYVGISFVRAKEDGLIVSLGDNQIFEFIRNIYGINYEELMDKIKKLNIDKNNFKKIEKSKENSKKIGIIQNKINELMFIPHIISVRCDTENATKKQYKDICKNGFRVKSEVNNKIYDLKYKRLCAGAGQLRRNTAIFVNAELYDDLEKIMMCGLDKKKVGKMNLAKFSAYYALYASATNKVATPRICVVKDFKHILKDEKISWIYDSDDGEKDIEVRNMEVEINAFDGSGIVCPEFAKVWQSNLKLDYMPSSFILRSAWIKGLVSVFDFKEFARLVAKKTFIVDAWGNKQYVKNIDVILTVSQFKMWKKYSSWEEYCGYHNKFGHVFGIARVNKKFDNIYTTMNYQYVQSNGFTNETICKLSDYSLDWVKKIMSGDELYTSLFLLGLQDDDDINVNKMENELGTYISKALMYNKDILNDEYIKMKINQTVQRKIDRLKIGKCLVEGSYEFAIPDLYAMAEHAFGMKPTGLLERKQCWSRRWVEKGSEKVAIMRSPLVAPAENQLTNIYSDEKCMYWFKYITSGIVTNVWDTTMNRCSDADYDGDLLLTSDDKYLINAVDDAQYPIMYEKSIIKEQMINPTSFANMDVKSFDTKIGFITNLASNFIAMLADYKEDSKEYKELRKRIDLLRYHQGVAIDSTKGDVFIPPPRKWSHKQRRLEILDGMTKEEIDDINKKNVKIDFENSICANRKPYFFTYVYPTLQQEYKDYKSVHNKFSRRVFGKKLNDLIYSKEKTKKERNFAYRYNRYLPVLKNNCTMNALANYVEHAEFENKWAKSEIQFDYSILKSNMQDKLTSKEKNQIKRLIGLYNQDYKTQILLKPSVASNGSYVKGSDPDKYRESFVNLDENLMMDCLEVCSNLEMVTNYVIDLSYTDFKNKGKMAIWNVFGEQVVENLKSKAQKITIAVLDDNGIEYLGEKYSLKEIEL